MLAAHFLEVIPFSFINVLEKGLHSHVGDCWNWGSTNATPTKIGNVLQVLGGGEGECVLLVVLDQCPP